jgi:predicted transcriptional regulator
MNFNIYLDSRLGAALRSLAKRRKLTRNALIRKAVEELLEKEAHSDEWSPAVREWQGDPDFPAFESHRTKLAEPAREQLA